MTPAPAALSSGVAAVDARWGGFATGGTYALVGEAAGGRLVLALHAVRGAVEAGARCLLVSARDPATLVAAARPTGLDLAAAHGDGRLRLLRMPPADALASRDDDGLAAALADLLRLVETDRPDRVVIDDFSPLAAFASSERFAAAFADLAARLRAAEATLVVGLDVPADAATQAVAAIVQARADGTLQIAGDRRLVLHGGPDAPSAPEGPPPAPAPPTPAPAPIPPPALPEPLPLHSGDGVPQTAVTPPPPADPALLTGATDTFGIDASAFLSQGFLVDSGAGAVVGRVPSVPPEALPSTGAPPTAPGWAPLGDAVALGDAVPPDARATFAARLDAAYAASAPFDAIAVRMDPASPASYHFETVADGLRSALAATDHLFADIERRRAVVLVAGQGRAGELFAAVQAHVRARLGPDAAGVLGAVAAAPIPGGAPFTSGDALLAYAVDQ